jgi:hypothetical protein
MHPCQAYVAALINASSAMRIESKLRLVALRHPSSEQLDAVLRPGTFSSWWGRWHHRATDAADPVVDGSRMCLDVIVARQVECLTHRPNISLCKEWANVGLIARQLCHGPHLLE